MDAAIKGGKSVRCRNFWLILAILVPVSVSGQLLNDSFEYTAGSNLSDNGWTTIRGGTSITVSNGSLSYTGYSAPDPGNSVHLEDGSESLMKSFGSQNSGSVYFALVFNASNAPTVGQDGFFLWIGATNTTIYYRLYALGQTHLLVFCYVFNSGTGDDVISMWINPDLSGSQPQPDMSVTMNTDASELAEIVLTGETSSAEAPTATIDGLRITTTWDDLFGNGKIFSDGFENGATTAWDSTEP